MGFDMLPTFIRESEALSNNEKAQLANCTTLPESIAKNTSINLQLNDASVSTIQKELAGNNAQAAWAFIETLIAHQ
jgi:hypothetical protein